MINTEHVKAVLQGLYPDLENIGNSIFRGIDRFGTRDYAIRYFDLSNSLLTTADSLKSYQENMLAQMYFSSDVATDLRWNHYLYFIASDEDFQRQEFSNIKARVEADREYARKHVVRESEIADLLAIARVPEPQEAMPADLATAWSNILDQHALGYILDSDITVPDVVRRIVAGSTETAARPVAPTALLESEQAAASHFIDRLIINGFRPHPEEKEHRLGRVNLIVGGNGVGKTSLLEAVEFAYCGRNRRSTSIPNRTSIELEFIGAHEKLSSTTDATRLRARHSNWYAKTELRTVTIQDSFGKFNFLDTDAAVNLSVTASSEQIGADVMRLVLGAAAENLADRLRRVLKQLQDELKDLRRDKVANQQLKMTVQSRLDAIRASPQLSDSLFLELLASIQAIEWLEPPNGKSHLDIFRKNLQEAISAVAFIQHSSINVLHADPTAISLLLTNLNEEASKASVLDHRAKSSKLSHADALRKHQAIVALMLATEALLPYARTDFSQLVKRASEYQEKIHARSLRLGLVATPIDTGIIQDFFDQFVVDAITLINSEILSHQQRFDLARLSLQSFETTQNTITVLRQRLIATAQEMLQRTSSPNHCPLCKTEFENGQLIARMMSEVEDDTSQRVSKIQEDISSENEALVNARAKLAILQCIHAFVEGDDDRKFTVEQAIRQIEQERIAYDQEQSALDNIQLQIQQLRTDGMSSEDLSGKLLVLGLTELPSLENLQHILTKHREALAASQNSAESALQEEEAVRLECVALAERLSIGGEANTEDLVITIRKLISDLEASVGARQTLAAIINIGDGRSAEEIALNLSVIQQLLVQVSTANAQEENNATTLSKEAATLGELSRKIEKDEIKIKRAGEAESLLDMLVKQSEGGELVNQILTENATEIARIFSRIHMPNEFEINGSQGSLSIIRRSTGAQVQLSHMSTGQRAAFALSLFLAMSGRLRSGPPILLFDDPVAHIDDINMLSFLDHLRSLAISGSRQIFFATADNKLAGLFRHKFRFLGEEFKELRLSRSS